MFWSPNLILAMNKIISPLLLASIALLVVTFPFLISNTNAFVFYKDNLDGELIYLHILKMNGLLLSTNGDTIVPNMMNGLPRFYIHSEYSFIRVLFLLLPSFWAYVVNNFIIRLIGFIGMYLFMRDYFVPERNEKIAGIVASLFCIVPLFSMYGLCVMGIPLLLWSFQKIMLKQQKFYHYFIIILFPFYAHFALIAPFITALICVYAFYRWFIMKLSVPKNYFIAIALLCLFFVLANFNIISSYVVPSNIVAHRSEWNVEPYALKTAFKQIIKVILTGHYHSASFAAFPIYLFGMAVIYSVRKNRRKVLNLAIPFVAIFLISVFVALYPYIKYSLRNVLHILTTFQLTRFSFLIPVMWFLLIGFSLKYSKFNIKYFYLTMAIQAIIVLNANKEIKNNYIQLITKGPNEFNFDSYKSIYSVPLFKEIDQYIGLPKSSYRTISLGIEPNVAQYNGFYTLDSYQNYYPLAYKHSFRKIIAKELDKNKSIKTKFDTWGNKCYLFSSELSDCCIVDCNKKTNCEVNNLEINADAAKQLGGKYMFSAVPVNNYKTLGITFLKKFTHPEARFDIYLYEL